VDPADFPRGVWSFPLVGLVIGVFNALIFWVLSFGLEKRLVIILTLLFNLLITGALHLDGLADTCDGVFSARTKERMLEIMKDSRIGTNGAIAVFFDLALKTVLLDQLNAPAIIRAWLVVPVVARTAMIFLMSTCPAARPEGKGLGNLFIGKVKPESIIIAVFLCLIIVTSIIRFQVLAVAALNLLGLVGYRWLILGKLGGMTGDTLGAFVEVSAVVTLMTMVLLEKMVSI